MTCPSCGTENEAGPQVLRRVRHAARGRLRRLRPAERAGARFCGECGNPGRRGGRARHAASADRSGAGTARPAVAGRRAAPGDRAVRRPRGLHGARRGSGSRRRSGSCSVGTSTSRATSSLAMAARVEKFIGDAVMAVWGAPMAHEDDAERAVRAALDLVDARAGPGPGIQARGGVLTGEAAVTIGAVGPGHGRGRPREHGGTPPVGRRRPGRGAGRRGRPSGPRSARSRTRQAGEQLLKGKARRCRRGGRCASWPSVGGRNRDDRLEAPFVGRDDGAAPAQGAVPRDVARAQRAGSSRSPARAASARAASPGSSPSTSTGSSRPSGGTRAARPAYGEGITFWALGEMVRRARGLLETRRRGDDPHADRARRSRRIVPDEDERRWIEPALLALLGAGDAPAGGPDELFAAWRTFFERIAAEGDDVLCSRTSTGRTRACSTSSTTCSTGPATSRSASSPGPARAARAATRLGRRQAELPGSRLQPLDEAAMR